MTSNNANPKRVMAISPTSRGFGFVVFESQTSLIEWAVKTVRQKKEESTLAKVLKLFRLYKPETVVVEDYQDSRLGKRNQKLLSAICDLAGREGLKSRRFSVSRVKRIFRTFGAKTKHEIAKAVSQQLPELTSLLPPPRKAWESEGYRMPIFDAAALALTYFYSHAVRNGNVRKLVSS